eukprot:CAMPEP_0174385506 /NCGR_PEP_ID=MMETSP0811_2-20130205/126642_1 /TAXON_ID=73025 ORGANISM="Eutreptiella gymnastica-like, Strain CCMP1594" /NCGR_SAMPLE_ID=MMETSP0811_2 /ASSEMBLY_ACC=CAM_ASM_000667 /LENGTH=102 /DNA_ID=CAMNT_0015539841 /DNA_START=89 /DNA_END=397 /DNA_ORIENTATION=+
MCAACLNPPLPLYHQMGCNNTQSHAVRWGGLIEQVRQIATLGTKGEALKAHSISSCFAALNHLGETIAKDFAGEAHCTSSRLAGLDAAARAQHLACSRGDEQ